MFVVETKLNDTTSPDSPSIEFIPETNEPFSSNQNQSNSSRPTSPDNEVTSTNIVSKSPLREETSTPPKELQDRRKSMSWKTFNLKRQLSKVNMKIGINVNTEIDSFKNNSVFYTQKEAASPVESGSGESVSPKDRVTTARSESKENTCDFSSEPDAEQRDCDGQPLSNFTKTNNNNANQNTNEDLTDDGDIFDISNECQFGARKVEFEKDVTEGFQTSRPSDLPLSGSSEANQGSDILCAKTARQKFKEKQRDQRLLSVPNIKYQTRDIRARTNKIDSSPSLSGNVSKKIYKLDGSFSRSRSSSMSSIDMSSSESVTSLAFIESYGKKSEALTLVPTLWIGTSFGSILTLQISLPEREVRKTQPVLVTINGGPLVRLKGSITSMSFLDSFGSLIPYSFEAWRDDGRKDRTPTKSSSKTSPTFTPTTANTISSTPGGNVYSSSSTASTSGISGSLSTGLDSLTDRQYIVITSEKQTKVFDIANQSCIYRNNLSEMDFAVKAETISMKDGSCLATYLSNGHLMIHSLPSLRLLMDTDFLPLMELSFQTKCKQGIVDPMLSIWGQQIIVHEDTTQISKIFCFSHKGHGLYMATPTEIQKFTVSSEFCQFILEMMGELYTSHEMPEQPKESFFKGLFGGGAKSLDREELFGEQSGKANRSVAKHIPGPNLDQLGQRASTAASEISRAHQLAMERGEKLNLLEERAERMANQAQDFSGTAHQLMLKYKDKKWYQL